MDNLSKFFVILASSTYAAMNTKFQSNTSVLVVGTVASVSASYNTIFSSDTGSTLSVGTVSGLTATFSTTFSADVGNNKLVTGTTGTTNATISGGMPIVASSSVGTAILGTVTTANITVTGMPIVASSSVGTAILGTMATLNVSTSSMPISTSASEMYREPTQAELPALVTITPTTDASFSSVSLVINGES